MNKKINLILGSLLLGGLTTVLPLIAKIAIFTGLALYLFIKYDEFAYNHDHKKTVGGHE